MTWVAVAIGGSAVVGAIATTSASNKANSTARKAAANELEFQQQQYNDWQAIYGPLQENLANYYSNVSPEYYATTGLENFQQQYQTSLQRINESFAQRGITPSSGISTSVMAQAELNAAEQRASIRKDAPRLAAEDQSRFLQIGLGQNPTQSLANTMAGQTQYAQQQANLYGQAAGQAVGNAITTVGTGLADYFNKPTTVVPPAITTPAGSNITDYNSAAFQNWAGGK